MIFKLFYHIDYSIIFYSFKEFLFERYMVVSMLLFVLYLNTLSKFDAPQNKAETKSWYSTLRYSDEIRYEFAPKTSMISESAPFITFVSDILAWHGDTISSFFNKSSILNYRRLTSPRTFLKL